MTAVATATTYAPLIEHDDLPLVRATTQQASLTLIKGVYRIAGMSPDGDSVKFFPYDPEAMRKAGLRRARPNAKGGYQLRLEGIDALETHFMPRGGRGTWHQPLALGQGASDALLKHLGFTEVEWSERGQVVRSAPDAVEGYIFTRFTDIYGRVIAFAFPGQAAEEDVTKVFLTATRLEQSVNYHELRYGWSYPTYYSKLFADLRATFSQAVLAAREESAGVWAEDRTLSGFEVTGRHSLMEELVILPKLFRRLAEYLRDDVPVDLTHLREFLAAKDDELMVLPEGHHTHFDSLVEVEGNRVRLLADPINLIFREK